MAYVLLGEVGGPSTSRGGRGPKYFSGRYGAQVLLGEVGGLHTSRGGRGPTYFSGR